MSDDAAPPRDVRRKLEGAERLGPEPEVQDWSSDLGPALAEARSRRKPRKALARPARIETLEGLVTLDGAPLPPGPYRITEIDGEELEELERNPEHVYEILARWSGKAASYWRERLEGTGSSAALVRPVYVDAASFHSRVTRFDSTSKTITFLGRELARIVPTSAMCDLHVILRGLANMGSVAAHRLFRWEVFTAHDRHVAHVPYANILEIDGGYAELARQLGLNASKTDVVADLRAIVLAQAASHFTFPDGSSGGAIIANERPARGRQRAHLTITLGPAMLPGYAADRSRALKDRKLVPLLRTPPPLHGRANEHGAQFTAALNLVAELRERAPEMVERGGAELTHDVFTRIADRSGLKRGLILPVRDTWLSGDERGAPPLLKRIAGDVYTLADVHEAERNFLLDGGRIEIGARKGGRALAAQRRIARLGGE